MHDGHRPTSQQLKAPYEWNILRNYLFRADSSSLLPSLTPLSPFLFRVTQPIAQHCIPRFPVTIPSVLTLICVARFGSEKHGASRGHTRKRKVARSSLLRSMAFLNLFIFVQCFVKSFAQPSFSFHLANDLLSSIQPSSVTLPSKYLNISIMINSWKTLDK